MKQRILTALFLCILIPVVFLEQAYFKISVLIAVGISIREMLSVFSREKEISIKSVMIVSFATLILFLGISFNLEGEFPTYVIFGIQSMITILILSISIFDKSFDAREMAKCFLMVYYIGLGFSSIVFAQNIDEYVLIYMLIVSFGTDTFAYFSGYFFGKTKLIEHISPKKTVEGAIGGTIIAVSLSTVFGYYFEVDKLILGYLDLPVTSNLLRWNVLITLSLTLSVFSQIGDLVASRIKREFDAKDFGTIFPGHGGVLDRFDSVLFCAISFNVFVAVLYVVIR